MHNSKSKILAVIWDLDGTLLDSGKFHYIAEKKAFAEFGIEINEDIYQGFLSTKIQDFVKQMISEKGIDVQEEDVLKLIAEKTKSNYISNIKLSNGALYALNKLHKSYNQALATAREKDVAMVAVKKHELKKYFDIMLFADDIVNGKPYPDVFLLAAQKLKVKPEKCAVVEDGKNGIIAAKKAGMLVIVRKAEHNSNTDFSIADHVVDDLAKLPAILNSYT